VRKVVITPKLPEKTVTAESVRKLINSALDEYKDNHDKAAAFDYFNREVIGTGFTYMLIPSIFNYCVEKNLSEKDTESIVSVLCEFGPFKSSDHKDLAKGIEELLGILTDLEDTTETVISQFAVCMSMILRQLNFSVTAEVVNCLIELKDCDPFCSIKEKKKYGPAALYFVATVSKVNDSNPEQATLMLSKAKDSAKLFNTVDQHKELFKMYSIAQLLPPELL